MAGEQLDVSVIICTYTEKRWDNLVAAVESVQQQSMPPHEIIVVVDNNAPLLERVRGQMPGIIAIENSQRRGSSGSRNSGIAIAQGALLAFLDDDAIAFPDWLERISQGCADPQVLGRAAWLSRCGWRANLPGSRKSSTGCWDVHIAASPGTERNTVEKHREQPMKDAPAFAARYLKLSAALETIWDVSIFFLRQEAKARSCASGRACAGLRRSSCSSKRPEFAILCLPSEQAGAISVPAASLKAARRLC